MTAPEKDARAHPRYEVDADADIGKIQNLSMGGICIRTSVLSEVGAPVDVVLRFHAGEEIALSGQVVWVNREPPEDVGIKWIDLDGARRDFLARHLAAALEQVKR